MKKIRFLPLVFAATMLLGCEKDDGPSASVEISIPGIGGNYNKPSAQMQYYGETGIKGVYATRFNILVESSNDPDGTLVMTIDAFHDSKSFAPGTYTFPSTGKGTAASHISIRSRSSGDFVFSGTAVSGQVSIAVSGESYTVTFNNVSVKTDDETKIVSIVYKGTVEYIDVSGERETINPDYPGSSTIKETISEATFPYMRMEAAYNGFSQNYSSHVYSVHLTSMENDGSSLYVSLQIFSDIRDLKGLYLATIAGAEGGRFGGLILLKENGKNRSKPIAGGQITIAESNGVYTVTLYNVTDGGYGYEKSMNVHGVYTGICPTF